MPDITGKLENWRMDDFGMMHGEIWDYDKHCFHQGQRIRTSLVISPDDGFAECVIIKTKNSTYLLGKEYK